MHDQVMEAAMDAVAHLQHNAFGISAAEMKRRLVQGQYPKMLKAYMAQQELIRKQETTALGELLNTNWSGRRVIQHGDALQIHGGYDPYLGKLILKLGGHWCGEELQNRKCFIVSREKMDKLLAALKSWMANSEQRENQNLWARRELQEVAYFRRST